ncbi:caspase family protein [Mesorhizobium sp. M0664]|uniref:caspase family protein n=1 Tax=Mesorhizobium sp. M0664 TaxID=2956982 RepID=UPI0033390722
MPLDFKSSDASAFSKSIHAVVVGVGQYARPVNGGKLKDLPECVIGAKRLAAVLVDSTACRIPDHQVELLTLPAETTKNAILAALNSAARRASPEAALFVYFAGHGLETDSSFYLATVDAEPVPTPDTSISAQDLAEALTGTAARGILIVVDCCGGAALAERAPLVFSALGDLFEYRILLSASRRGQSSWELPGEGSPFTNLFIDALSGHLPTVGKHGEIYFRDLSAFLVNEMRKLFRGRLSGLKEQEPKAEISAGDDPLVFVNSDISLESVRLNLARFSIKDFRRRLLVTLSTVVGIIIAVTLGIWTWLDQHKFARVRADGVELLAGYPDWNLLRFPDPIWEFDIRNSDIRAQSLLGPNQPLVLLKRDDPADSIGDNLTEIGRARFAMQLGRNEEATTLARSILQSSGGLSKNTAYDAKDIIIAAAPEGDGASIADLVSDEKLVATRALQRIATIDAPMFEKLLASGDMIDPRRFDQELVFPRIPPACTSPISAYVERLLGKEWAFNPYAADLVARTRCVPTLLGTRVDWKRIVGTQAYLRRLLSPSEEDKEIVAGFDRLVEDLLAEAAVADAPDLSDPRSLLGNSLDAAVAFDRPAFKCSQKLLDLIRKFSEQPDGLDFSERASVTAYLAQYCLGEALIIKASEAGEVEIGQGAAMLVSVPLQTLDAKTIQALAAVSAGTMVPLLTYQVAGNFRAADKLQSIFAMPDLPASVNLLEGAAAAQEEDLQAAALLWVFHHRRADLVPMVKRLGSTLLGPAILRISIAARSDQPIFAALERFALDSPGAELRTCWTTIWGPLDEAINNVTKPALEERKVALSCLSFRGDLPSISSRIARSGSSFYADVLARVSQAAREHDRLVADIKTTPASLKKWRAGVDFTETLGGRLLLVALVPDPDLMLR